MSGEFNYPNCIEGEGHDEFVPIDDPVHPVFVLANILASDSYNLVEIRGDIQIGRYESGKILPIYVPSDSEHIWHTIKATSEFKTLLSAYQCFGIPLLNSCDSWDASTKYSVEAWYHYRNAASMKKIARRSENSVMVQNFRILTTPPEELFPGMDEKYYELALGALREGLEMSANVANEYNVLQLKSLNRLDQLIKMGTTILDEPSLYDITHSIITKSF